MLSRPCEERTEKEMNAKNAIILLQGKYNETFPGGAVILERFEAAGLIELLKEQERQIERLKKADQFRIVDSTIAVNRYVKQYAEENPEQRVSDRLTKSIEVFKVATGGDLPGAIVMNTTCFALVSRETMCTVSMFGPSLSFHGIPVVIVVCKFTEKPAFQLLAAWSPVVTEGAAGDE